MGEQLLRNNDFAAGLEAWEVNAAEVEMVSVGQGQVQLHSTAAGGSTQLSQNIKKALPGGRVVLKAWLKTENISTGPKKWNKGRVLLLQYQLGKPQYKATHELTSLDGTSGWTKYRATFPILPGTTEVRVILQMSRCTGKLYCRDMSLFQVEPKPVYGVVQWSIVAGWFCFGMVLFGPALSGACRGRWKPALTVLAIIGIIVGTTLPGTLKNELKVEFVQDVKTYSHALSGMDVISNAKNMALKFGIDKSALDISKLAHFVLFGLLTFLLLWQHQKPKPLLILIDVLMLACATELLQLFVEGRGALPLDVVIDMAGSVTGFLLWKLSPNEGMGSPIKRPLVVKK